MQKQGVQCPDCHKRLFSWHRHQYKTCGCPNDTMVDGGDSYLRYGGAKMPAIVEFDPKKDKDERKIQSK